MDVHYRAAQQVHTPLCSLTAKSRGGLVLNSMASPFRSSAEMPVALLSTLFLSALLALGVHYGHRGVLGFIAAALSWGFPGALFGAHLLGQGPDAAGIAGAFVGFSVGGLLGMALGGLTSRIPGWIGRCLGLLGAMLTFELLILLRTAGPEIVGLVTLVAGGVVGLPAGCAAADAAAKSADGSAAAMVAGSVANAIAGIIFGGGVGFLAHPDMGMQLGAVLGGIGGALATPTLRLAKVHLAQD